MNWPQSLLVSLLSSLLGLVLGGLIGIACVKWFRMTSFEGASGFAVVGIAISGGLVSAVIGWIAARWSGGGADPSFLAGLLRAAGSIGVAAFLVAAVCRLFAHPQAADTPEPVANIEAVPEKDPFALPPADAPLSAWLAVIRYGAPEATVESVLSAVVERPDFPAEARLIVFDDDHYLAAAVFRLMALTPDPHPEWNSLVSEAGIDVADRFRSALSGPGADDSSFREVADVAVRFYGWIDAAEALRARSQGNFHSELKSILELAEPVTTSLVLQNDVSRIARHHLQKWSAPGN